jgi:hypothetical protein
MWRIEGICASVTRGRQGRQRQEFDLRLSARIGQMNSEWEPCPGPGEIGMSFLTCRFSPTARSLCLRKLFGGRVRDAQVTINHPVFGFTFRLVPEDDLAGVAELDTVGLVAVTILELSG